MAGYLPLHGHFGRAIAVRGDVTCGSCSPIARWSAISFTWLRPLPPPGTRWCSSPPRPKVHPRGCVPWGCARVCEAHASTHHYLQPLERAVLLGQAAFRAARGLAENGFVADVVVFHAGFGPGLYLKDAFPRAGGVGWFEWFYEAHGTDADFLDPAAIGPDDELRIRTLNAGMLVELAACDRAVTPTEWQRDRFPDPFRAKLETLHEGIDSSFFAPGPPDAGLIRPTRGRRGRDLRRAWARALSRLSRFHPCRRHPATPTATAAWRWLPGASGPGTGRSLQAMRPAGASSCWPSTVRISTSTGS